MALQEKEIALCKFKAGIYPSYSASDFSFIPFKSSPNKKPSKTVHQKSSISMHAL